MTDKVKDEAHLEDLATVEASSPDETIVVSLDPADWELMPIADLRRLFGHFFHLQAKVRHLITRKEIAEGKDDFPNRVPSYQDIHTCSLLITDKPGHGPAIAVAVSEGEKGWHVWQKDVKTPDGGKHIMQYAYIRQHLQDEYPVLIRMTSGKEGVELAIKKDSERLDELREKYQLGPITPRPWNFGN